MRGCAGSADVGEREEIRALRRAVHGYGARTRSPRPRRRFAIELDADRQKGSASSTNIAAVRCRAITGGVEPAAATHESRATAASAAIAMRDERHAREVTSRRAAKRLALGHLAAAPEITAGLTSIAPRLPRSFSRRRKVARRRPGSALCERRQRCAQCLTRLLAAAAFGSADRAMSMVGRVELAFVGTGAACRQTGLEDVELRRRMSIRLATKDADRGGACVRTVEA